MGVAVPARPVADDWPTASVTSELLSRVQANCLNEVEAATRDAAFALGGETPDVAALATSATRTTNLGRRIPNPVPPRALTCLGRRRPARRLSRRGKGRTPPPSHALDHNMRPYALPLRVRVGGISSNAGRASRCSSGGAAMKWRWFGAVLCVVALVGLVGCAHEERQSGKGNGSEAPEKSSKEVCSEAERAIAPFLTESVLTPGQ